MNNEVALKEKYMLTIKEAAVYFNIGTTQMRKIAENHKGEFSIFFGNRYMIVRERMEQYIIECIADQSGEKSL